MEDISLFCVPSRQKCFSENNQAKFKCFSRMACWVAYFPVLCLAAQSCPTVCDPVDCRPPGSSVYGDSPGNNTRVGCHALPWGIFPPQASNPGLPIAGGFFNCLSHQGIPRILKWVAYPFVGGTSPPRKRTGVS